MRIFYAGSALSWRLAVSKRSIIGHGTYEPRVSIVDVFLDETTVVILETHLSKSIIFPSCTVDILVVLRLLDVTSFAFGRAPRDWPAVWPTRNFANRPYRYLWCDLF